MATAQKGYAIEALEGGAAGDQISVEVADASEPSDDKFKLIVKQNGREAEVFDNVTTRQGREQRRHEGEGRVEADLDRGDEGRGALAVPPKGSFALSGGEAPSGGIDRRRPDDYVGNSADRTGFAGLESVDEVTMLCVPDLAAALQQGMIDMEQYKAVQLAMIAHCELMADRVAILDPPPG